MAGFKGFIALTILAILSSDICALTPDDIFDLLSRRLDDIVHETKTSISALSVKFEILEHKLERLEQKVVGIEEHAVKFDSHTDIINKTLSDKQNDKTAQQFIENQIRKQRFVVLRTLRKEKALLHDKEELMEKRFNELTLNTKYTFQNLTFGINNKMSLMDNLFENLSLGVEVKINEMNILHGELKSSVNISVLNMTNTLEDYFKRAKSDLGNEFEYFKGYIEDEILDLSILQGNYQSSTEKTIQTLNSSHESRLNSLDRSMSSVEIRQSSHESKQNSLSSWQSSLESQISSVKSQLSSASSSRSSLSSRISDLNSRIGEEEKRKIAFSARQDSKKSYYTKNERLRFDTVIYSYGGGYDSSTGIFRVPKTGTYLFTFNVQSTSYGHAHVVLKVDGTLYTRAIAGDNINKITGGNVAIAFVYKGQKVWIETADLENRYYIWPYRTTFNGILID